MKNKMKKFLCTVLVVILCLTSAPLGGFEGLELPEWSFKSSAANALAETGQCGDDVYWNYSNSTGELTISGTGAMWNFGWDRSPFCYTNIEKVIIKRGVTSIGEYAFQECIILEKATIPDSVTIIGSNAFCECKSLISATIPDSVTTIGSSAFSECENLTNLTIPKSVTTIGRYAFESTNLTNVTIPNGVTVIEEATFGGCSNLTSVTIPRGITTIGKNAFAGCSSLISVTIPISVTTIGDNAFYACNSLENILVADNNKNYCSIDGVLFSNNKGTLIQYPIGNERTSYTIPNSTTTIGSSAFQGCIKLTDIIIPDNVNLIDRCAFEGCEELASIRISSNIKTIGSSAFYWCNNLVDIYYNGTEEQWNNISIHGSNNDLLNATIHFLGEDEPHTCLFGDWFTETESTVFNEGVSKRVCQCGKSETKAIAKLESGITKDQTTSIEIVYREENFDNEFTIVASEEILDKDIIFGDAYQNFKVYDISLEINNEKIQPKGYITVKIPLPEHFNPETTAVYYISDNNTVKLESKIENGFVIFETDHFSLYAIVDKFENTNPAENCSCNCHKGGIMGFFWKIINFFNKLLKNNQQCKCGVAHY